MVQLRVKNNMPGGDGEHVFIDLYENDPIRINLSIEDLRDTAPTSMYSQSFRVPDTPTNNLFFRSAFSVNVRDFDVTVTHSADLMVDGSIFKRGDIRLMKIYSSHNESLVEYEILFVGETRSLSSAIGSKNLNELDTSELVHFLNYQNLVTSWDAQPDPDSTAGLFNGNVIYPLIHFGNNYNEDNIVTDTRISSNGTSNYFVNPDFALEINRFKPMVRARWLFEKIFEEAGFTIQSNFFDTELFMKLYVSAFGNDDRNVVDLDTADLLDTVLANDYFASLMIPFSVVDDPGFHYQDFSDQTFIPNSFQYKVPISGNYAVKAKLVYEVYSPIPLGAAIRFSVYSDINPSTELDFTIVSTSGGVTEEGVWIYDQTLFSAGGPNASFYVTAQPLNGAQVVLKAGSFFRIPETVPGGISISYLLDNKYKQIDFIKDIMTTFRLVIEPSKTVENEFIIEPWVNYIGTGDIHDWTSKIDDAKDTVIEPLFYEQSQVVNFTFDDDEARYNKVNVDKFNEPFGTLRFDSQNDLLRGTKEFKVGYAPTPVTQIEGATVENNDYANMVIPHIYTETVNNNLVLYEPMRPKTRLMFWNGMVDNNVDGYTNGNWYVLNDSLTPIAQSQYPRVSPYSDFPLTFNTKILTWQKENGYVRYQSDVGFSLDQGLSLYDVYWSKYINLLYDPWSRKINATIKLNADDVANFSFSDLIFIKGTYYYVSKINNLTLNDDDFCTIELVKFNPFRLPEVPEGDQLWNTWGQVWNTTPNIWGQF